MAKLEILMMLYSLDALLDEQCYDKAREVIKKLLLRRRTNQKKRKNNTCSLL